MISIENNRFFDYLKSLDRNEFNEFMRIVSKNKLSKVAQLMKLLKPYYPDFNTTINKAILYKKIYKRTFDPQNKKENQRFMDIINDLTIIVEDFIVNIVLRRKGSNYEWIKIQALRERGLTEQLKKSLDKYELRLETETIRDDTYYEKIHKINDIRYNDLELDRNILIKTIEALDKQYIAKKMRLIKEVKVMQLIQNYEDIPMYNRDNVLNTSKKWGEDKDVVFELYSKIQGLFIFDDIWLERYNEVKILYKKHFTKFSGGEQLELMSALVNTTNHMMSKSNAVLRKELYAFFKKELYLWYRFGLDHTIFIQNEQIHEVVFSNIYRNILEYESLQAAEDFAKQHFKYLKKETRIKIEILSKSMKAFEEKDFTKVVELLKGKQFRHYAIEFHAKSLLIRALYQESLVKKAVNQLDGVVDQLGKAISAFDTYVGRNFKEHDVLYSVYKNFLKCMCLFIKYPYDNTLSDIENFIKENPKLSYSLWFKKKLQDLK